MKETQERIVQALKNLLEEMPYRKITVNELCLRAGVSRNTFYANFEDKEDTVRYVFVQGIIQPIRDLNRLLTYDDLNPMMERMNEQMYERLAEDGAFYRRLVTPMRGCDDTFIRVATNAIYDMNMELIPRVTTIKDDWKLDYVSYFFASSQAMLMQKWVSEGFEISSRELAGFYSNMTAWFWRSVSL